MSTWGGEAYTPGEIADRSICIDGDIGEILKKIKIKSNRFKGVPKENISI